MEELQTENVQIDPRDLADSVASFSILSSYDCPTATELLVEFPHRDADQWNTSIQALLDQNIDRSNIGMLLALYPDLADTRISATLDQDVVDWLNSVADAVTQLRETLYDAYAKGFVVDHEDKFIHLQKVGQNIFEYQAQNPDAIVSDLIVEDPVKFVAVEGTLLSREMNDLPIASVLHVIGVKDVDVLRGSERVKFMDRIKDIDPEAEDYKACVNYAFEMSVNGDRVRALKLMAIKNEDAGWLDDILTLYEEPLDSVALARIAALYELFDQDGDKLANLIQANPELLTKLGVKISDLVKEIGLSDEQVKRLAPRVDVIGSAVRNTQKRIDQFEANGNRRNYLKRKHGEQENPYQDIGLCLSEVSMVLLKEVCPNLGDHEQRTRARILALQAVVGKNLANLVIEDNLSYLTIGRPTSVIEYELPLTEPQRQELRRQLESRRAHVKRLRQATELEADMVNSFAEDEVLQEKAATIGALLLEGSVELDVEELFSENPKLFTYDNYELMAVRIEALVGLFGAERAEEIIKSYPLFLATAQAVSHIKDILSDTEAVALKARLKKVSDSSRHRKARQLKNAS